MDAGGINPGGGCAIGGTSVITGVITGGTASSTGGSAGGTGGAGGTGDSTVTKRVLKLMSDVGFCTSAAPACSAAAITGPQPISQVTPPRVAHPIERGDELYAIR